MLKTFILLLGINLNAVCQTCTPQVETHSVFNEEYSIPLKNKFIATSNLLDAAINSLNCLNGVIKKENYRNKITAFNNPASADMGFSLEAEIQHALKPILDKAKNTNTGKFSAVISSLLNNTIKDQFSKTAFGTTSIFSSLLSLVGNLTITEKKVTRADLDSFMITMNKYFVQYE